MGEEMRSLLGRSLRDAMEREMVYLRRLLGVILQRCCHCDHNWVTLLHALPHQAEQSAAQPVTSFVDRVYGDASSKAIKL